jgi:hypothetical protein
VRSPPLVRAVQVSSLAPVPSPAPSQVAVPAEGSGGWITYFAGAEASAAVGDDGAPLPPRQRRHRERPMKM